MKNAKLSASARADLDAIWLYVAERDGPEAADRLIDRLVETFPLLAAFPNMCRPRQHVLPDTYVFAVDSYLIFYRKRRRHVEIARIVHGARDIRRP